MNSLDLCNVCDNSYNNPRILPCLHSFCHDCISSIRQEQQDEGSSVITCPTCNETTQTSLASFPFNIRLKEQTEKEEIDRKATSSSPVPCDPCKNGEDDEVLEPSVGYCRDCEEFLCNGCWKVHQKIKATRSHSSFKLNEDNVAKPSPGKSCRSINKCLTHPSLTLKYFCSDCCIPICSECCIDFGHTSHEICKLDKPTAEYKTKIQQSKDMLTKNIGEMEKALTVFEEMKETVNSRIKEAENDIKKAFKFLYKAICEREKAILTECNQIATAKQTRLSMQQEGIQALLNASHHCCTLSSSASTEYSDIQLLSIAQTVLDRATKLQEKFANTSRVACETADVSVETPDIDDMTSMMAAFASVVDTSPCDDNATVLIPRTKLGLGAEMNVTVTSRGKNGDKVNNGRSSVEGSLDCCGQIIDCAVIDNDDGTYTVVVKPTQLGECSLRMTINGQAIQGSPFSLRVVQPRDYCAIVGPVLEVQVADPRYIACSSNGDVFITSTECIHIIGSDGKEKATIGNEEICEDSIDIIFHNLHGLAIHNDIIFVADCDSHKIHKLTTGGEYLDSFGDKGHNPGELYNPLSVAVSPNGMIYVCDDECRVQVFNFDWSLSQSLSHVIDGKEVGIKLDNSEGLAFDLSGNVHFACHSSESVVVFTPSGEFVCQYGQGQLSGSNDIAIDSSGYSIVANYDSGKLFVFNPTGCLVHSFSIGEDMLEVLWGLDVSPTDSSIWSVYSGSVQKVFKF